MIETNKEKPRILLADDNDFFRYFLQEGLSRYGTVDTASSLAEAWGAVVNKEYDLAVLDEDLRDGDGLTLANYLYCKIDRPYIVMSTNLLLGGGRREHFENLVEDGIIDAYTDKRGCEETVKGFRLRLRERLGYYSDKPILVAESPHNIGLVESLFQSTGLDIDVVRNGYSAVNAYLEKEYGTVVIALHKERSEGFNIRDIGREDLVSFIREAERGQQDKSAIYMLRKGETGYNPQFDVHICDQDNLVTLLRKRFPRVGTGLIIDPNKTFGMAATRALKNVVVDGVRLGGTLYVGKPQEVFSIFHTVRPRVVVTCPDPLGEYPGIELARSITSRDPGVKARRLSFDGLKRKKPDASDEEIVKALSLQRL